MSYNLTPASAWILSKFRDLESELDKHLKDYELSHSIDSLYKFLWDDFADWYVEYLKTDNTQITFAKDLFKQYVLLLSPYAPFETEALWEKFFGETSSLSLEIYNRNWSSDVWNKIPDKDFKKRFETVIDFVNSIRSVKGLFAIDPVTAIKVYTDSPAIMSHLDFIKLVTKVDLSSGLQPKLYTINTISFSYSLNIFEYIKDPEFETNRTKKIILDLEKQIQQLGLQLSNQKFMSSADSEVVAEKQLNFAQRNLDLSAQKEKLEMLAQTKTKLDLN